MVASIAIKGKMTNFIGRNICRANACYWWTQYFWCKYYCSKAPYPSKICIFPIPITFSMCVTILLISPTLFFQSNRYHPKCRCASPISSHSCLWLTKMNFYHQPFHCMLQKIILWWRENHKSLGMWDKREEQLEMHVKLRQLGNFSIVLPPLVHENVVAVPLQIPSKDINMKRMSVKLYMKVSIKYAEQKWIYFLWMGDRVRTKEYDTYLIAMFWQSCPVIIMVKSYTCLFVWPRKFIYLI